MKSIIQMCVMKSIMFRCHEEYNNSGVSHEEFNVQVCVIKSIMIQVCVMKSVMFR